MGFLVFFVSDQLCKLWDKCKDLICALQQKCIIMQSMHKQGPLWSTNWIIKISVVMPHFNSFIIIKK